ncbi:MAG TPA: serine hydrolase domain-containing protein, partial [Fimbriimonas sp.]|nr:serine hydrolase domain-containing protein [Fimbriimonas sp.]
MPLIAALFILTAPFRAEAPLSERFVIAANGGAETFKTFLAENFATDDKAFLGRLDGFRQEAAPLQYIRKGFSGPTIERALIKGKLGELTMTLMLNGATPPKITGLLLGGPGEVDKPPAKQYTNWKSLQSLTDEIRTDNKVPAIGVGVIENGKLQVTVSGEREIDKGVAVKSDDIWNMGSIGKSFTATLIGRLVEEGKLKWDSTLGELLPKVKMKDAYKSVKLSDILRHRGGIAQDQNFTFARVQEIVKGAT